MIQIVPSHRQPPTSALTAAHDAAASTDPPHWGKWANNRCVRRLGPAIPD
jgi:hypothetical protein